MKETITFVVLMAVIIILTTRCSPATSAALDVAGYTAALTVCRDEGKRSKSYLVYETCAKEADRKFGLPDGGL